MQKQLGVWRQVSDSESMSLRWDKRLVNEGQNHTLGEGLAFERQTSPGPGPDVADRLAGFKRRESE